MSTTHTPPSAAASPRSGAASKPECTLPGKPHSHVFRRGKMVCLPYVLRTGHLKWDTEGATRLINAIGWDAGNESMRRAGRTVWSRADYLAAAREANRLFKAVGLAP